MKIIKTEEIRTWDLAKCHSMLTQIEKDVFALAMSMGIQKLPKPHLKSVYKRNIAKLKFFISELELEAVL